MAFETLVPYWNGFFKERVFFSYGRCASCELLFAPTFFREDQLASLYEQMPPNMDGIPPETLRRTQRGYFEVLKANARLEGDYIEVGPDIGLFTQHCVAEGKFKSYWLFEPNRQVWPALTATMTDRKYHLTHDMLGFSQAPDGSAGVAVMIHVLDHLLDPVGALHALRGKLSVDGAVVLVTHNEASILRRILARRWPAFCLQHPQLYSPRSIRSLVEAAGYEVVQIRRTVNYFPLHFLIKHVLWAVGLKIDAIPAFGGVSIGLKLGNIITVAKPRRDAGELLALAA